MRPIFVSLKAKVTFFTLTLFVIGLWSLAYYAQSLLRKDMEYRLGLQQASVASVVASQIDRAIVARMDSLALVAGTIDPALLSNPKALQLSIESRILLNVLFNAGVFVTRRDGTAMAEFPHIGRIGNNYMDRDHVATALNDGRASLGRPIIGRSLRVPSFAATVPIRDAKGVVIGALSGITDLSKASFLDVIGTGRYGETGGFVLVDPRHRLVVTSSDKARVMEPLPAPGVNPMLDLRVGGFDSPARVTISSGVEVLSSAARVPAAGWHLVALLPMVEALAPIRETERRLLFAAFLLTLLAGGLTWWVLKRQLVPMLDTVKSLAAMSLGDRAPQPLPMRGPDELSGLIRGFNGLLEVVKQRESALGLEVEKNRALLRSASDGITIMNREGTLVEFSDSFCAMLGYSRDELNGKNVADWDCGFEGREALLAAIERQFASSERSEFLTRHRRKDGSIYEAEISGLLVDMGGQSLLFNSTRDISARLAAEREIKQTLRRFDIASEAGGVGVWELDLGSGAGWRSRQHAEIFGQAGMEADWSKGRFMACVVPEDRERVRRHIEGALVAGGVDWQGRIVRSDGAVRNVAVKGTVVHADADHGGRMVGTVTDVTARIEAEEVLRLQEAIIANMQSGVCLTRAMDGVIVLTNPKLDAMFGYGPGELVGKAVSALNAPNARTPEETAAEIVGHLKRNGVWNGDIENLRKDGTRFWCHAAVSMLEHRIHGKVWIAIHQDVTLRKQAETALKELTATLECRVTDRTAELQSALRDMETFSYSIAHDLRTPVRAILSISSLLEEDYAPAFDAAGHDYVRRVQQAAARMGGMIDGLLGLARLLRSEFRAERIDMSVMVRAVAEGLEAGSGGRRVALDIQPQVEVFADRTLASVLIENLIGNAWKFTEKRPDARIEFGLVEKDGVSACFVRDNGAGFDMGHAENLFRPFHRLHAATDFPGNGIGLATAQRIVQRHGGKIWAESSLGAGATFYFTLPEQRSTA